MKNVAPEETKPQEPRGTVLLLACGQGQTVLLSKRSLTPSNLLGQRAETSVFRYLRPVEGTEKEPKSQYLLIPSPFLHNNLAVNTPRR